MLALERLQVEQLQVFQAAELVGASFNHKSRRFGSETCPFAALNSTRARHASPICMVGASRSSVPLYNLVGAQQCCARFSYGVFSSRVW